MERWRESPEVKPSMFPDEFPSKLSMVATMRVAQRHSGARARHRTGHYSSTPGQLNQIENNG
jgi:hypothetical protein